MQSVDYLLSSLLGACVYLTTERKYALIKKYVLNKHVHLITRLRSILIMSVACSGAEFKLLPSHGQGVGSC